MKRAAIVSALSCATLLVGACTNDFDGLFAAGAAGANGPDTEDDGDEPTKPTSSSSGSTTSGDPIGEKPICGKGCSSQAGTADCTAKGVCDLICNGGSQCVSTCQTGGVCSFVTNGSNSESTCNDSDCSLECLNGSTCKLNCAAATSCEANCESSACTVVCPKLGDCNVTCGDGVPATKCPDGTSRACGGECGKG